MGQILRSEIVGAVKVKACLSGMPELRLGLNDKVKFDTEETSMSHVHYHNQYTNNNRRKRV